MNKNILYIMIGAPGSGKTTIAKNTCSAQNNTIHISRDEIRFSLLQNKDNYFSKERETYKEFTQQISKNLATGYNVIADATHLNKKSRYHLFHNIHYDRSKTTVVGIYMKIPLEMCLEHNEKRKGTPTYVPPHDLYNMYEHLQPPNYNEPFDYIYIYDGKDMIPMRKNIH